MRQRLFPLAFLLAFRLQLSRWAFVMLSQLSGWGLGPEGTRATSCGAPAASPALGPSDSPVTAPSYLPQTSAPVSGQCGLRVRLTLLSEHCMATRYRSFPSLRCRWSPGRFCFLPPRVLPFFFEATEIVLQPHRMVPTPRQQWERGKGSMCSTVCAS